MPIKHCRPTSGPKQHRYIRGLFDPPPPPPLNSMLHSRGQRGHALNYQLSTGPPTKSNRNYEPVTRPEGPASRRIRPLSFFLPPSLRSYPLTWRFISYVHADEEQCENWGSVSPGCWHSSYSRDGTHLGTTRRSASRSGADWSPRETRRYDWYFIAVPRNIDP